MKHWLKSLMLALALCGCDNSNGRVQFVFFNLGPRLVWVEEITGLPATVAPGNLVPVQDENDRLNEKSMCFHRSIDVEEELIIKWSEGGLPHSLKLSRTALGLPRRLTVETVRFTYLGNRQWRVKVLQ